jgi:uncharacterized membrane protein
MIFDLNSRFLYMLGICVVLFVLMQSLYFLKRAIKRGLEIGITYETIRRVVVSTAIFTIAPALAILLGVISLSKFLGIPLPWIRLSILGAITYELSASASAALSMGISMTEPIRDSKVFTTIVWVMTLGIIPSMIIIPVFMKSIQRGLVKIKQKDERWGQIFMDALFMGMISAFLGLVFGSVSLTPSGMMPLFVLFFSAAIMVLVGTIVNIKHWRWLEDFALPFSIIGAMAFAVFLNPFLQTL